MIQLLRARCRACDYQATVGVGADEDATVPVLWAPALCPACGVVSVNVADQGEARCHGCGGAVTLYAEAATPCPARTWVLSSSMD